MASVEGGGASYLAIRAWEIDLMTKLQVTEEEYASMPLEERARRVVASQLRGWIEMLESDRVRKEVAKKYAGKV